MTKNPASIIYSPDGLRPADVSEKGRLYVELPTVVASGLSTNAALGANEEWISDWVEVLGFADVSTLICSDVISADPGVFIEWSSDGIEAHAQNNYAIKPSHGCGCIYTHGIVAKYMRIRFINGPFSQSTFVVQSILHSVRIKPSTHRINEELHDGLDAELVKAVMGGKTDLNRYLDVGVTQDRRLKVAITPPELPTGKTSVNIAVQSSIGSPSDNVFIIPNGAQIILQRFGAGAGDGNGGSKVELFYDPNGNENEMTLLRSAFVNASNSPDFNLSFTTEVGNGTRAIRLRRTPILGSSREILGFWDGYY
jgi:hypothetical protein